MKRKLVILGAGESGVGASILGKKKGFDVFVSDSGKIKEKFKHVLSHAEVLFEEGKHSLEKILKADIVVKSPGIADDTEVMNAICKEEIKVVSEIEFAAWYTKAKKICITGSNGKTTTTLLIHHILKNAGLRVGLAGNVGQSFAMQVVQNDFDYYVLEISSFQLDGMFDFKADIAVLLNITPDHLDRYNNSFKNYIDSKFRIIQNQTAQDAFIYCCDDEVIIKEIKNKKILAKQYPFSIKTELAEEGAFLKENEIIVNINSKQLTMTLESLALQGKHNIYNSMAAGIAARILDIRKDVIKESMADFQNIEHRLEFVLKVHGIEFINDSKATNVNSTWYALESMSKPVIWIVGGIDKGNNYRLLSELVGKKVKAIVCLGKDNRKIHTAFKDVVKTIVDAQSAKQAVETAYYLGEKGDVVLLSPACASFDLFENYEERGRAYKQAVKEL